MLGFDDDKAIAILRTGDRRPSTLVKSMVNELRERTIVRPARQMESALEASSARRVTPVAAVAGMDSDLVALRAIRMLMAASPTTMWAGGASTLDGVRRLVSERDVDILIVDSHKLPRMRQNPVLAAAPKVKVLVRLSACHVSQEYVRWAHSAGIQGLCEKDVDPGYLVQAVNILYRSGHFVGPTLRALPTQRQQTAPSRISQRELDVLFLIADGLGNHQIASALGISTETARSHVKSILTKLEARNRTHAVSVAFRSGLLTART